jgi:hypothetical protein
VVAVKLKCGVHAERESETRPIFVCHHCGMPVCEEHGWVVLADDAFDVSEEPVPRSAMHCPECAAGFHPRGMSKRRGWVVKRPRAAADQEAPAAAPPPPGYGPAVPPPPPPPWYPEPPYPPQPRAPRPTRDGASRP